MKWLAQGTVAMSLFFAAVSMPANAAHVCTPAELKEVMALIRAAQAADIPCDRALNRKFAPGVVQKACKACAADIRQWKRIDAWIAKHPKCARDSHLSKLHRVGHQWRKSYEQLCR